MLTFQKNILFTLELKKRKRVKRKAGEIGCRVSWCINGAKLEANSAAPAVTSLCHQVKFIKAWRKKQTVFLLSFIMSSYVKPWNGLLAFLCRRTSNRPGCWEISRWPSGDYTKIWFHASVEMQVTSQPKWSELDKIHFHALHAHSALWLRETQKFIRVKKVNAVCEEKQMIHSWSLWIKRWLRRMKTVRRYFCSA